MATLHPTRRIQVLTPKFAERFQCIGSQCEDTCCTGWRVDIDKKTFKSYRQTNNPILSERLKAVKRVRSGTTDANYGRIELLPETAACPMIEDQLCSIQKELGEDKLSNTCFTYPRTAVEAGGFYQQALTLSCPEAARLALLAPDAFEFTQTEKHIRPSTIEKLQPRLGLSIEQINEIRFFCIQVIRTESFELWQKIALVGLFCETVTQALNTNGQHRITEIMATTQELMASRQMSELFESLQPNYEIQAITFAMLWDSKTRARTSSHQDTVNKAVAAGLGADAETGEVSADQLIQKYTDGIQNLPKALKDAPMFLENYIVNEMWRETFPFGSETPFDHYLRLVIRFGLVRFMLAAQCSQGEALPDLNLLAQTVQTFCRRYQHDAQFALKVNGCFENSGWSELQKIYRFLKA